MPTIATRRSRGIMTRGRLSGKGEENCDKDRKRDIGEAKIRGEEDHERVEKRADDRDKEKQRNHDKGKTIWKRPLI